MDIQDTQDAFQCYVSQKLQIPLRREESLQDNPVYSVPYFTDRPNRNHFDERPQGAKISELIIHYTVENFLGSLEAFTRDATDNRVSAHYVITETETPPVLGGTLIQVVPEAKRAWHAGISNWQGRGSLNATSIGIELVNPGRRSDNTWVPFDVKQISTLGFLCQKIVQTYPIKATCVIGHADIAPGRKQDPGPLFPWGILHEHYGIGAWLAADEQTPEAIHQKYKPREELPKEPNQTFLATYLKDYGYDISKTGNAQNFTSVLTAFQAHFSQNQHPENVGKPPSRSDMFWIWALVWKYRSLGVLTQRR
jgi:N-acetylmuramoyl-L-alanine amidase